MAEGLILKENIMRTFDSIGEAREGIVDFRVDHFDTLSDELKKRFKEISSSPSPVDQIVGVMELLYANRAEVTDPAKELIGGLAAYATVNAWHGLAEDNRGNLIVQAMRRDLGEKAPSGVKFQKPDEDPAPKEQYVIAPETEQPAPAPEVPAADA
jgi:hypothetical protein